MKQLCFPVPYTVRSRKSLPLPDESEHGRTHDDTGTCTTGDFTGRGSSREVTHRNFCALPIVSPRFLTWVGS